MCRQGIDRTVKVGNTPGVATPMCGVPVMGEGFRDIERQILETCFDSMTVNVISMASLDSSPQVLNCQSEISSGFIPSCLFKSLFLKFSSIKNTVSHFV